MPPMAPLLKCLMPLRRFKRQPSGEDERSESVWDMFSDLIRTVLFFPSVLLLPCGEYTADRHALNAAFVMQNG